MSRVGAWWLRREKRVADFCESVVVGLGLGPVIDKPYPPRLPTERESAARIATQLERIANAIEPVDINALWAEDYLARRNKR